MKRRNNTAEFAPELNLHHVAYHKRDYRKKHEREFREYHGLKVISQVAIHNHLHRELFEGPPKPPKAEMGDCIDYMDDVHESLKVDRFWGIESWMKFTLIQQFENEAETDRYEKTRWHLARQIGILSHKSTGIEFPSVEELHRYGRAA